MHVFLRTRNIGYTLKVKVSRINYSVRWGVPVQEGAYPNFWHLEIGWPVSLVAAISSEVLPPSIHLLQGDLCAKALLELGSSAQQTSAPTTQPLPHRVHSFF